MPSGGRRLPPWTSPRGAEVSRWSPCTPATAASSGHVTPVSGCSRPPRVPSVGSPYVQAKQAQLAEKDPNKAVPLFWAAINSGDRIESALKDMATVLKQANRAEEAIEAIRSFRDRCPNEAQESLDNILLDLYKKCGRTEEQIEMLTIKLRIVDEELASGRWKTKLSRSHGRITYLSLKDEKARLLGNLAWAYMQSENYEAAGMLYRQALAIETDYNRECNLAICLMKTGKVAEAKYLLEAIPSSSSDERHVKSFVRATEMLMEFESPALPSPITQLKHKEPRILLAADVEKLERRDPQTLSTPMTQLKYKIPQIPVPADAEKHKDCNLQVFPSPVTQLKRKEPQILVVSGGERDEGCEDEYLNFSRLFNDAATPQSILEKLRKRLIKDDTPNLSIQHQVQTPSTTECMQEGKAFVNGVRKTWAEMVEEEEQQLDVVGTAVQNESSKHASEQKYRTPSFSQGSSTLQRPITGGRPVSSSAGSWRRSDCKVSTDENVNWKFARSAPTWKQQKSQDYNHGVCQRFSMIHANEKHRSSVQSQWRNGTAQRSLFSDWKSKSEGPVNGFAPHYWGSSYTEATNHWPSLGASTRPWRQQNRLQVFQEITDDINQNVV